MLLENVVHRLQELYSIIYTVTSAPIYKFLLLIAVYVTHFMLLFTRTCLTASLVCSPSLLLKTLTEPDCMALGAGIKQPSRHQTPNHANTLPCIGLINTQQACNTDGIGNPSSKISFMNPWMMTKLLVFQT